jgi:hypothetical protein
MSRKPPTQSIAEELAAYQAAKETSHREGQKLYEKLQSGTLDHAQFFTVMELYLDWHQRYKSQFEVSNES